MLFSTSDEHGRAGQCLTDTRRLHVGLLQPGIYDAASLHPPWSTYTTGTQHWSARPFIIIFLPVPVRAENAMASLSAFCGRRQTFPIVIIYAKRSF